MTQPKDAMSKIQANAVAEYKALTNCNMHRSVVTWTDVKDSITDIGLWGHWILTAIGLTPTTPLQTCLYCTFSGVCWFG